MLVVTTLRHRMVVEVGLGEILVVVVLVFFTGKAVVKAQSVLFGPALLVPSPQQILRNLRSKNEFVY